jgi:hypothetical protein
MVTFARGLQFEDRIRIKLQIYGCTLQSSPILDHRHKLDFVVTQFPETQKFHNIGVQVTERVNSCEKLQEFHQTHSNDKRVTERAVYIELSPGLDLESGGSLAVFNALTCVAFNKQYADRKIIGVTIDNDLTYSFFVVEERTTELILAAEKAARGPAVPVTKQLTSTLQTAMSGQLAKVAGYVHAFSRAKNIGFITAANESTYFFSRNAVIDDRLDIRLNSLPYSEKPLPTQLPVRFADLGRQRGDAKYNSAGLVELDG